MWNTDYKKYLIALPLILTDEKQNEKWKPVAKQNVSNDRVLSLNRASLRSSCLKGHAGFAFTHGKGRCALDGAEGDRPMQGMRVGRPAERKRYETAVLVLWRQVLVYRPTHTDTPSNTMPSYAPFLSRGAHPAVSFEWIVTGLSALSTWPQLIRNSHLL